MRMNEWIIKHNTKQKYNRKFGKIENVDTYYRPTYTSICTTRVCYVFLFFYF